MELSNLEARAMKAYFKYAHHRGLVFQQPADVRTRVSRDGDEFVILSNVNGVVAVYRLRYPRDGRLRRIEGAELAELLRKWRIAA